MPSSELILAESLWNLEGRFKVNGKFKTVCENPICNYEWQKETALYPLFSEKDGEWQIKDDKTCFIVICFMLIT